MSDLWAWVYASMRELSRNGQARLAELCDAIPTAVCREDPERADAMVREALPLARAARLPWIEVFIRHWDIQNRVLHRGRGTVALEAAVSLFEFAHREETKSCPQSTCATQDLAATYGRVDGPGYAEERIAVCTETLARIDPSWPCFDCISAEYAQALEDLGRFEDSIAFIERQGRELVARGKAGLSRDLAERKASALLGLGRDAEALAELGDWRVSESDASKFVAHRLMCARANARVGNTEAALEAFLPFDEVAGLGLHYRPWLEAACALSDAGMIANDAELGITAKRLFDDDIEGGALYEAAWVATESAALAAQRGRRSATENWIELARRCISELRPPNALRGRLAELEASAAAIAPYDPGEFASAAALLDVLSEDPELRLDQLVAADKRWPDDAIVSQRLADTLSVLRFDEQAEAMLRADVARRPSDPDALARLARLLLERRRHDAVDALLDATREATPELEATVLSYRAYLDEARGRPSDAMQNLERLAERAPAEALVRLRLARLYRDVERYADSLRLFDSLVEELEPGSVDWDRMVVASLVRDWEAVRRSALRLEIPLTGDGPVFYMGPNCRIEFAEPRGTRVFHARRVGPVSAEIIELAAPDDVQHFGDIVVFDAAPRNPDVEPDEDGERVYVFPCVKVLERGGYLSYILDGVHPGDEALATLRERLRGIGALLSVRSGSRYVLEHDGVELPGLYAFIGVPSDTPPRAVHDALASFVAQCQHPLTWAGLVEALGLTDELERQREIIDVYGI